MVVCKFFLQGTCKFGDYCKFDHGEDVSNYQSRNGNSILRQPNFGGPQSKPAAPSTFQEKSSSVDIGTLTKSVVNDMALAEKGNQWLLSCYAPFREKPAFPGFEDHSFEELRFGFYEAVKSGKVEQYKQYIQSMLQQAVLKRKALQAPSPDVVNLLKELYNTSPSTHSDMVHGNAAVSNAPFGQHSVNYGQGSSIYAQGNQNIFANCQQSAGAGNSPLTGNTIWNSTTNNPFNNQLQPQSSSASIFKQNDTTIVRTQQPIIQGTTGSSPLVAQPSSFFGPQTNFPSSVQAEPQKPSIFAQVASSSNLSQNTNIFGQSAAQQATHNIFGTHQAFASPPVTENNAVNGIFGTTINDLQSTNSPISAQIANSAGQPSNSNFSFGQANLGAQPHSANLLGSLPATTDRGQQLVDESIYSKLEDLTEDEIKWFESDDLDISRIPEKPPTYNMCFKT